MMAHGIQPTPGFEGGLSLEAFQTELAVNGVGPTYYTINKALEALNLKARRVMSDRRKVAYEIAWIEPVRKWINAQL